VIRVKIWYKAELDELLNELKKEKMSEDATNDIIDKLTEHFKKKNGLEGKGYYKITHSLSVKFKQKLSDQHRESD
jgi:hypothetical protein